MNAYAEGVRDMLSAIGYGLDERELTELENLDTRVDEFSSGTPMLNEIIDDITEHWSWAEHALLIIDGADIKDMFDNDHDRERYASLDFDDFEQIARRAYEMSEETYRDLSTWAHEGADELLRERGMDSDIR